MVVVISCDFFDIPPLLKGRFRFCFSGLVACALGFSRISPISGFWLLCCFSPLCMCVFTEECRVRAVYLNPHEIDQFSNKLTNPNFNMCLAMKTANTDLPLLVISALQSKLVFGLINRQ